MAGTELQNLRILGILGQGGSGKTSLAEAMLFTGGATQRLGRVQDGTFLSQPRFNLFHGKNIL
jgi:elongation factor G